MGKEHTSDNCCWLWIINHPNTTLMKMSESMHSGSHTHMSVAENASSVVCVFPAGVLLFDRSQGFWLSHSVPHFPSFPERGYLYPSSGKVNGQTALCVTYRYEQFPHIGEWPLMRQQGLTKSISVNILDVNLQNSLLAKTMKVFALLSGLT